MLLRRAILSALNQTYRDIEVFVCDDASDDDTAAVVAQIARGDARVRYYCQPGNVGPFANHIFAARQVETPFFSLLDDDDILAPVFYEAALDAFARWRDAMFVVTHSVVCDRRGRPIGVAGVRWRPGYYPVSEGLRAVLRLGHVPWTSTLYRREVVEEIKCIDGNGSDMYFALRASARWPFVVVDVPGAVFHRSSDLSESPVERDVARWLDVVDKVRADASLAAESRVAVESWLMSRIGEHLFKVGVESIVVGRQQQLALASRLLAMEARWRTAHATLRVLAWACRASPLARRGVSIARNILRDVRARRAVRVAVGVPAGGIS